MTPKKEKFKSLIVVSIFIVIVVMLFFGFLIHSIKSNTTCIDAHYKTYLGVIKYHTFFDLSNNISYERINNTHGIIYLETTKKVCRWIE